jgi:hypothetical protein
VNCYPLMRRVLPLQLNFPVLNINFVDKD